MRNPLIGSKPATTNAEPPDRVVPIPESYAGTSFPYRSDEPHGVEPTVAPSPAPGYDGTVPVPVQIPKPPAEPMPVRIVGEASNELRTFRVTRSYCSGPGATQVIGRNEHRTLLRITNMDAARTVFIANSQALAQSAHGYPLKPGVEISMTHEDVVYAMTDDGVTQVALAVYWEQPVEESP